MAERLTPQQEMAVHNRGGKLLVSAAAGSGKTKVLVDRLMCYLTDPEDPANLDDFLMITFTKAAASELRSKIAAKLTERISQQPENRHLQQQIQRLYLAKISTVHSFCGDILREYAYRLDLPADFRVADENECAELREAAVNQLLDAAYSNAGENPDFTAFVDSQGLGRDDRLVPKILKKVYDNAICHMDPDGWLESCIQNSDVSGFADISSTVWGEYLMDDLLRFLDLQIEALSKCRDAAERTELMEKPAALFTEYINQLIYLRQSSTWDEIVERSCISYGRLVFSKKCPDQDLADRMKAVRSACKNGLDKKLKAFSDPSHVLLEDLRQSTAAVRGMISLVRDFIRLYDRMKARRRILDFGDLEHKTVDLLLGIKRSGPTSAAAEIAGRFREIMVDEYQDTNEVQDTIYSVLTHSKQNCFMVGDVKQSIYQFRQADPGIFLEKYNRYASAEDVTGNEGRKVLLSSNFRSSGGVIAAVNDVFETCMSPRVGGLEYGEGEILREGIPHIPLGEPEVELYGIQVTEETYAEEAAFTAKRIQELLDGNHMVRQGDMLRPILPEDIAILLRSPGSVGSVYKRALEAKGIRCCSGGGVNLLETEEIGVLRALLQAINNPRQDIPLIAAIANPIFDFSADDLAAVRSNRKYGCFYEALKQSDLPKARYFLESLNRFRKQARMKSVAELLDEIFFVTKMDSIYAAMENGEERRRNLHIFYQLAADFESAARRDLSQFLDHLTAMEEDGLIAAGEQTSPGCVTMMSIHKSKGLEFPVVFLCGLSKEFNRESQRAQVLCDKNLGVGLSAVDQKNRVRYPTVAKRAIALKSTAESLSEEMRVLYVAMTRARDRHIMTYAARNLESDLADIALRMGIGDPELLTSNVICAGEWVLMTALRRTEAGELFALGGKALGSSLTKEPWLIKVVEGSSSDAAEAKPLDETVATISQETIEQIRDSLAFRYQHLPATSAPSKQTVTQMKGRIKDLEAAENTDTPKKKHRAWRSPSFVEAKPDATAYGTAMHAAMQYISFDRCSSVEAVSGEIAAMTKAGYLTPEQGGMVNAEEIAALFTTQLGKKLMKSQQVLREFKFSVLDDGKNYDSALSGEQVLLQGVVDCTILEDDGITVIDFKTDRVSDNTLSETVDQYRTQITAYADAMSRIYGKKVKERILYFFRINRAISVR